jgi:pimeloyl-ACP methyl ester carboxylesterase
LLGHWSSQHAQAIARNQIDAARETAMALSALAPQFLVPNAADAFSEYAKDCTQRWILFLDTLCQRGEAVIAREKEAFAPVLAFDYDLIVDGRKLERPVNYALVRIHPPEGTMPPREDGRPWVIIDPRAGHGSGIGGFKSESEVGVALRDGHPVYFIIFYPEPVPGQTLADVCAAEAAFLREIYARHPASPRPLITGNCQRGWATMILAATHPDLMGPIVVAGAPLSYWAGQNGRNPFRYFGGIAGGAVPALLAADLGAGKFDGAHLVLNFELLNPGKNWFRKNYDLFADVDRGAARFLQFERWWSGFLFHERRGDPLDRREFVCRQQAHPRRSVSQRRHAYRPDPDRGAGRRLCLLWRQHHAAEVADAFVQGFSFPLRLPTNSTSRSARWSKRSSRWRPGFMKC